MTVVRRSQKIFATPQSLFPGVRDSQNLINWRSSLPLPTNPVWWGSMHTISSYRGTNTATNPHTNRQDRLQCTAPQLARSVTMSVVEYQKCHWLGTFNTFMKHATAMSEQMFEMTSSYTTTQA